MFAKIWCTNFHPSSLYKKNGVLIFILALCIKINGVLIFILALCIKKMKQLSWKHCIIMGKQQMCATQLQESSVLFHTCLGEFL
jgi:hypothetical protein